MPENILIVYASTHGQTEKIAGRIAETMRAEHREVEFSEVTRVGALERGRCDMVVVAASLHRGHHQRDIVDWVKGNRVALAHLPTAFISVSLQAADDSDESRAQTQECIDAFVEETGWRPQRSEAVAGALQYREYDVFTRLLMRLLMRSKGLPTDTSHDYDYTDWDRVEQPGQAPGMTAADSAGGLDEPHPGPDRRRRSGRARGAARAA